MTTAAFNLPSLPSGMRWEILTKRSWNFLALQRETWYGWKTMHKVSINPAGLGMQHGITNAAQEILDKDSIEA